MKLSWNIKSFTDLSTQELYDLLQLRSEVFVVEQDCVYQDIDGTDQSAMHVLVYADKTLVATARIFMPTAPHPHAHIGRVIVKMSHRKKDLGHQLMDYCIQYILVSYPDNIIEISAQQYLIAFYQSHGFTTVGEGYLEDDIPHIKMLRNN